MYKKINVSHVLAGFFFIIILWLTSCAERQFTEGSYDDLSKARLLDDKFNETDMRMIGDFIADSLSHSSVTKHYKKPPVLLVTLVKNKTDEHIDMKSMTDKIRVALIKSGQFRFTDKEVRSEIADEISYQKDSGYVSSESARQKGRQIGAQFFLTGEITSNIQQVGDKKYTYYKATFNLVNIETGLMEWSDEKELRKAYRKHSVGF